MHADAPIYAEAKGGPEQITSSHPDSSCKRGRAQSEAQDDCAWKPCHFNFTHVFPGRGRGSADEETKTTEQKMET